MADPQEYIYEDITDEQRAALDEAAITLLKIRDYLIEQEVITHAAPAAKKASTQLQDAFGFEITKKDERP